MKIIVHNYEVLIDEQDLDLIKGYSWVITKDHKIRAHVKGSKPYKRVDMSRLIMNPEKHLVVDHKNGNRLDNRRDNLRVCSQADNCKNKRTKPSDTGYIGVNKRSKSEDTKYLAAIKVNKRKIHIGSYETAEEAAYMRDLCAIEFFGEFAVLNLPEMFK